MAFLLESWLTVLCLLTACALLAGAGLTRWRHGIWAWRLHLPGILLAAFGLGAAAAFELDVSGGNRESFLVPPVAGAYITLTSLIAFVALLVVVIVNGFWSAPLGYLLAAGFFFGLGAVSGQFFTENLNGFGAFLLSLRPQEPWWLLLLALAPVLFWTSYQNLISLGTTRRWLAIGFRCALIVFLACALAEMFARRPNDHVTVLFLWDRSLSMPPEFQDGKDLRDDRIRDFINNSVELRSTRHANDKVGVIVFGKQPRLELPPSTVPKLGFKKVLSQIDRSYTDLAGALKLALASFPEGAGKRIVIISDGNENIGLAEEQAKIATQNGVQIDVVPIASGELGRRSNEILVEPIETPVIEKDSRIKLRVVVRSYHPEVVVAQLNLRKLTFDPDADPRTVVKGQGTTEASIQVKLQHGLNVYTFTHKTAKDDTVHAYEATIVPILVETAKGAFIHKGLPGDRIENNEARVCVIGRGERSVLVLEPQRGSHQLLVDRLKALKTSLNVVQLAINERDDDEKKRQVNELRERTKGDPERLAAFLSKFDAVILANLPADALTEEEQKVFRSAVFDQGMGLLMIGGNMGFGAGGWQNTEIEKALPVNCELKSMKIEGKSGLVLMMHASEMAEGNAWQRRIAKLALEKLSPMDMFGQIHYDHGFNGGKSGHRWHIAFQEVGNTRNRLMKFIDSMEPGDMPDVDPQFEMAYKELTNPEWRLGTKHIIFISDGDHWDASRQMLQKIKNAKITCTTVCITTHGVAEVKKMAAVALATGGRPYHIRDPKELPAIYTKETRLVSQSFVHENPFKPILKGRQGPTDGLDEALPPLHGFVRTTPRDSALVKVLIETPVIGKEGYKFPILATWQYGLGRSAAFTSDARTLAKGSAYWDRDWANSEMHAPFWEQTINWLLRPNESGKHLFLTTRYEGGKILLRLEGQDADKTPLTDLELKAGISSPSFKAQDGKKAELKFEQKETSGVYVAELPAEEVGAYFLNIQAKWKREVERDGKKVIEEFTDNVRAGVTLPYSPEFAEMASSPALLERLRDATGGKMYADAATSLQKAAKDSEVFRPVPHIHANLQPLWPWFVFLTALCLLFDVAIRRIAIQPEAIWVKSVAAWERLRGRASADEPLPEYIERLKSRKAAVGEAMDKQKAAKKFEAAAGAESAGAVTVVPVKTDDKPKPQAPTKTPDKKKDEADDFATRLMKAKKKALEDRDK